MPTRDSMPTRGAEATTTDIRMLAALTDDRESGRRANRPIDYSSGLRPVKPRGSLAVAGFVALLGGFVSTAGAGSASGMVAAMGAGVAISGLVYGGFTARQRRLASKVAGTAHVVSASPAPSGSTHGRCEMRLVLQAPRLTVTAVRHRDSAVPATKWPAPGMSLPVTVDPRNLRDLRVHWDRVRPLDSRPRVANPRVEQLSGAPAGAPGQEELATLADASGVTAPSGSGGGARGTSSAGGKTSTARAAEPLDPGAPLSGPVVGSGHDESISLSFLDAVTTLADDDPLLEEYGSPIREVGVTLIVSDLKQSLEFYRDLLGFFEIESGPDMVLLEARTGRLVLRQRDDTHATAPRLMHLSLEVNDIDAAYRSLARRGVEFIDEPRTVLRGELLELWAVSFHDPDGHGVALTCWRPRPDEHPA
jgi:catechol 2,3-dioxygenase-like lactoylglutathione lyase family enzyme